MNEQRPWEHFSAGAGGAAASTQQRAPDSALPNTPPAMDEAMPKSTQTPVSSRPTAGPWVHFGGTAAPPARAEAEPAPVNPRAEGSPGGGIGGAVKERARLLGENLRDAGTSMAAGARSALAAVNEWTAERERDMAAEAGSGSTMAAVQHAEGDRVHAAQRRAEAGEQAQQVVDQYADGSPGYHAMGLARSAPMMAAAVATRSPTLGALAIGGGTFAEQRSQALADGATPDQATASGIAHGALEGSMDALTLGLARWGFGPVKEVLTKRFGDTVATRMLQQASATAPRRLALATAEGAATEVPTTVGQMASDELILGADYDAADYARGIRDSAVQGGAMSGGVYAATAPLRRLGARGADADGGDGASPADPAPMVESGQVQALREQADQAATSGPIGRAASDVLHARADALEQAERIAAQAHAAPASGPWQHFAPAPGQQRSATEAATVIDQHVAALEAAAADGRLDGAQVEALTTERAQLDDTIRGHLRRREQGIAPADPAQARELQAALPELEQRRAELDRQLERHRLATGRGVQLERLQDRLSKIDRDADLIELSQRLAPFGDGRTEPEGPHDEAAARRTEPDGSGRAVAVDAGGRGGPVAGGPPGAAGAVAGEPAGIAATGTGDAAGPPDAGTAAATRSPVTVSPATRALQEIAAGAPPATALDGLTDADVHAVAKAMGRDFSPRAPARKVAEKLGEGAPAAWQARAARAVSAMPQPAPAAGVVALGVDSQGNRAGFENDPVAQAASTAATSPLNDLPTPTEAQREANNFKVGRMKFAGLDVSIEYPAGVKRRESHDRPLSRAYGYFPGTVGKDKDQVDVFIGARADDPTLPVFVVDQVKADGSFDESKVIVGEPTEAAARAAYMSNYPDDWSGLGGIRRFTQDEFKAWVKDPAATSRPAAEGIALDRAQRLTERFTKGWGPDAPRVVLARNSDELRQAAGLAPDADVGNRAEGTWKGQPAVFLNLSAIDSPARFRQVLAHEALGHYGIDRVVGDGWGAIETAIGRHVRDGTGSSSVRSAIAHVRRTQPDALNDPNTAAREVLAVMAEQGARNSIIDRIIAAMRSHLRRIMPGLKVSDAELRDLLRQADGFLRRNAASRTASPAAVVAGTKTEQPAAYFSRGAEPGPVEPPDVSQVAKAFEHLDGGQRAALGKIDTYRPREGFVDKVRRLSENWQAKAVQGVFDQFRPLKDLDETAYMQARLSKGTDGAVEGVFRFGPPKLTEGALDVRRDGKGFAGVLQDLGGEHDLFLAWVAGNRAERLASEGREHAFSQEDIASLKRLARGTMPDGRDRAKAYTDAQRSLNRYNKAVLDVAEQAGLLNPESRKTWESEWYVPFYRVMEGDGAVSPGAVGGIIRQRVIERLKGGAEPLGDLLQNTLANWSHLLSASMKNMAAARALDAAVDLGVADRANAGDKGAVWAMKEGRQVHYTVNDPLVFDALTMLHHPGWNNPAMKAMQWFKRALTTGVTSDPAFRIRNLMRDTVSVIAANPVGYNPFRNLVDGWKATTPESDTYLKLLGGGGAIRFGSLLDGDQAANAKRLVKAGVAKDSQILDTREKVKGALSRSWEWWKEIGDRAETVNRAAIYQQAIADGKTHLEASYAARDALDFTMQGKWAAVRFLTQTVPFMNARLQGLHKLGRGAKADPRRFTAVTGAVAAASALLYLASRDDEEFRALPDWVRDTYWWVRVPGTDHALFIPRPFEVGALGSVVERGTELLLAGDDYRAKDFAQTLQSILSSQLSMNPVPQMFRPGTEAAFNWNSFQDRPIDGMGQERLPAQDRYTARTSAGAIAAGKATGISPQRIEHMVRGYFGWLGTQALAVSDMVGRTLTDMPANPAHDFTRPENLAVVGAFVRPTSGTGSKYVDRYYREQDRVQQVYAAYTAARHAGEFERAEELRGDDRLKLRGLYTAADRQMKAVNQRIRRVTADRALSAGAKAELLEGLHATRSRLAQRTVEHARQREKTLEAAR